MSLIRHPAPTGWDEEADSLTRQRQRSALKFNSRLNSIFDKYGRDFGDRADEIDLKTGEIVVDRGHIAGMMDEADAGLPEHHGLRRLIRQRQPARIHECDPDPASHRERGRPKRALQYPAGRSSIHDHLPVYDDEDSQGYDDLESDEDEGSFSEGDERDDCTDDDSGRRNHRDRPYPYYTGNRTGGVGYRGKRPREISHRKYGSPSRDAMQVGTTSAAGPSLADMVSTDPNQHGSSKAAMIQQFSASLAQQIASFVGVLAQGQTNVPHVYQNNVFLGDNQKHTNYIGDNSQGKGAGQHSNFESRVRGTAGNPSLGEGQGGNVHEHQPGGHRPPGLTGLPGGRAANVAKLAKLRSRGRLDDPDSFREQRPSKRQRLSTPGMGSLWAEPRRRKARMHEPARPTSSGADYRASVHKSPVVTVDGPCSSASEIESDGSVDYGDDDEALNVVHPGDNADSTDGNYDQSRDEEPDIVRFDDQERLWQRDHAPQLDARQGKPPDQNIDPQAYDSEKKGDTALHAKKTQIADRPGVRWRPNMIYVPALKTQSAAQPSDTELRDDPPPLQDKTREHDVNSQNESSRRGAEQRSSSTTAVNESDDAKASSHKGHPRRVRKPLPAPVVDSLTTAPAENKRKSRVSIADKAYEQQGGGSDTAAGTSRHAPSKTGTASIDVNSPAHIQPIQSDRISSVSNAAIQDQRLPPSRARPQSASPSMTTAAESEPARKLRGRPRKSLPSPAELEAQQDAERRRSGIGFQHTFNTLSRVAGVPRKAYSRRSLVNSKEATASKVKQNREPSRDSRLLRTQQTVTEPVVVEIRADDTARKTPHEHRQVKGAEVTDIEHLPERDQVLSNTVDAPAAEDAQIQGVHKRRGRLPGESTAEIAPMIHQSVDPGEAENPPTANTTMTGAPVDESSQVNTSESQTGNASKGAEIKRQIMSKVQKAIRQHHSTPSSNMPEARETPILRTKDGATSNSNLKNRPSPLSTSSPTTQMSNDPGGTATEHQVPPPAKTRSRRIRSPQIDVNTVIPDSSASASEVIRDEVKSNITPVRQVRPLVSRSSVKDRQARRLPRSPPGRSSLVRSSSDVEQPLNDGGPDDDVDF